MKSSGDLPVTRRGFTLVEVMVALALAAVLTLLFSRVWDAARRSLTENDARTTLKENSEKILSRIDNNVRNAVRLYFRISGVTPDDRYSIFVDLTGCPPRLLNSTLGRNVLFLAARTGSIDIPALGQTVRLDRYEFIYDYLSEGEKGRAFWGNKPRHLYEWRSVPFADYNQIVRFPLASQQVIIDTLIANGVRFAYDVTSTFFEGALFALTPGGLNAFLPGQTIPRADVVCLTKNQGERFFAGFSWCVSPNTSFLSMPPGVRYLVPFNGLGASDPSPSGFEVFPFQESPGVDVRLVLVAQGAFPNFIAHEGNLKTKSEAK